MNRRYAVRDFREIVEYLKAAVPGVTLSTDIIVGFPYETAADHAATMALLKELRLDVPQVTELCRSAAEKVIKKPVKVVGPGVKTGLNIKLDDPATAGSDLVVVAVAALNEYTCPQIVIDMGTATTMSVLDQKGSFIGGVILPGLRTSLDALVSNAAQLSQTSLTAPKKVIGKNTLDCMKGGMIYGNAASIDGMIDGMVEELGCNCTIVATGGLAIAVIPHCRHDIIIDENLLLKGLQIIYEKNR